MEQWIGYRKSVVPACDVPTLEKLEELVWATATVRGIGGYKIGLELVIPFGLRAVKEVLRNHTKLPIIYDHQKGGNDIPEMGAKFARAVKCSGADAAILFPFAGGKTQPDWIRACQDEGLLPIVGGHMTHPKFLISEGGYIPDGIPSRIYLLAVELGVRDFVVPGNKPELVKGYRVQLGSACGDRIGQESFRLFAPGFISQGGDITETGKIAGSQWHAIVGSALYKQEGVENMKAAALKLTAQILTA